MLGYVYDGQPTMISLVSLPMRREREREVKHEKEKSFIVVISCGHNVFGINNRCNIFCNFITFEFGFGVYFRTSLVIIFLKMVLPLHPSAVAACLDRVAPLEGWLSLERFGAPSNPSLVSSPCPPKRWFFGSS